MILDCLMFICIGITFIIYVYYYDRIVSVIDVCCVVQSVIHKLSEKVVFPGDKTMKIFYSCKSVSVILKHHHIDYF